MVLFSSSRRRRSKKPLRLALRVHVIIAVLSVAVIAALGNIERSTFVTHRSEAQDVTLQTIGIENATAAYINAVIARKGTVGYFTLQNASPAEVYVSLPANWKRVEVKGAPLSAVIGEKPQMNLVRWHIPVGSSLSLTMSTVPTTITFVGASDAASAIALRSIDLLTDAVNRFTVLLKRSSTSVKLWPASEANSSGASNM